jgi:hypothetical protein
MVARRKKKSTRRRSRQKGVSILGVAETYMLASVATQTLFNLNALEFVMGQQGAPSWGVGQGQNKIGLKELFDRNQYQGNTKMGGIGGMKATTQVIKENLNANWGKGVAGMILIPLGFRVGKQVAKPAITRTNRLLGKAGVANTVKV